MVWSHRRVQEDRFLHSGHCFLPYLVFVLISMIVPTKSVRFLIDNFQRIHLGHLGIAQGGWLGAYLVDL